MASSSSAVESEQSLVADVARFLHDIRMGNIDVLNVFFVFWIVTTGLVYLGFTLYDKSRAIRTKRSRSRPPTAVGQSQRAIEPKLTTSSSTLSESHPLTYSHVQPQLSSPGYDFRANHGVSSSEMDWVNCIAHWIYSQQSQCTPQQVSSSWLKALNDEAKRQGVGAIQIGIKFKIVSKV